MFVKDSLEKILGGCLLRDFFGRNLSSIVCLLKIIQRFVGRYVSKNYFGRKLSLERFFFVEISLETSSQRCLLFFGSHFSSIFLVGISLIQFLLVEMSLQKNGRECLFCLFIFFLNIYFGRDFS